MDKIYLGKVIKAHGIKGEIRILSNFKHKNKAFKIGNELNIDNDILHIVSYRVHKNYDMIRFSEYNNINDILKYINKKVYIDRKYLDGLILDEDLIGMDAIYNNKTIGKVVDIVNIKNNPLIVIYSDNEKKYIPNNKEFIEIKENKVYIKYMEGLM